MGQLQRVLRTISTHLAKLSSSQKLLIGSLVVVMVMALFLVQQYTGGPTLVELLPGATAEDQAKAVTFLQASSVPYKTDPESGAVMVAPGTRQQVLAKMSEEGKLPADTKLLFDSLIEKQSWMKNHQQNAQMELVAVQNELSLIIAKMTGVKSARVIIDAPQARPGIGTATRNPTASVTVWAEGGLNQKMVDAIAHLVAGSRAGLNVASVRVIDAVANRQLRASEDGSTAIGSYLELVVAVEERKRQQLYDMLSPYIPGVVVTVHAQVDNSQKRKESSKVLPENKGSENFISRESVTERRETSPSVGGEPGVRSNIGADVVTAGGSGGGSTETQTDNEYAAQIGMDKEQVEAPGGYPTKINAVVNIPRDYFVKIWRSTKPAAGAAPADGSAPAAGQSADPTDQDLDPIRTTEIARIKKEVELQLDTSTKEGGTAGTAEVSMIYAMPADPAAASGAAATASMFSIPGAGPIAMGDLIKTVGLGALAVIALGMVMMTAFKGTKQEKLPSAAELVGLPPALDQADADLVGEAVEAESALAGIELSEDELKHRRMLEEVAEMVKARPVDAAAIVGRWVTEN